MGKAPVKTLFGVVVACCILLLAGVARAATYHVSVTTGSDKDPGTAERPFKTIGRASEVLQPGDTAIIHEGVYHEQVLGGRSGKEGAPITFQGVDRDKVVMRGAVHATDWRRRGSVWAKYGIQPITDENAFVMVDEKDLLERVESIVDMPEGSFHLDSAGIYTIRLPGDKDPNTHARVEVYEKDLAFYGADRWGGTSKKWMVFRSLTIEKYGGQGIGTDQNKPEANSHWELDNVAFRLNVGNGVFRCLNDWFVHDCLFERNQGHGCQIDGARVRFTNNVCRENEWFGPTEHGGAGVIIGPDKQAHSCVVSNNRFERNGYSTGYGCAVYLEGQAHHNRIVGNTIVGSSHAGIGIYGSSFNIITGNVLRDIALDKRWKYAGAVVVGYSFEGPPVQAMGNLIAHNTVWRCSRPIALFEPSEPIPADTKNRFVNNVFAVCRFLDTPSQGAGIVMENNAWIACPERAGSNPELREAVTRSFGPYLKGDRLFLDRAADLFVDPAQEDFRPSARSPLVNAGIPLQGVTGDAAGNPRICGDAPDIGAYEFTDNGCHAKGSHPR